jgi:hypothetical protein
MKRIDHRVQDALRALKDQELEIEDLIALLLGLTGSRTLKPRTLMENYPVMTLL